MKREILAAILGKERQTISEVMRHSNSSTYSCYAAIKKLKGLGIVNFQGGEISLPKSPTTAALQKLVFSNFDTGIFGNNGLTALVLLTKPKTVKDLSDEIGLSMAQTYKVLKLLGQFLSKEGDTYAVSEKFDLLMNFLRSVSATTDQDVFWRKGNLKLLKMPKNLPFDGSLTAFSRFSEFGVAVETESNYIISPEQQLSREQVLAHALKFAKDANDVALCIIFYLKNKALIDITKLEKEAKAMQIAELWNDIAAWLEDYATKNPSLFLPKSEVAEKARLYKVVIPPRYGATAARNIFMEAGQKIKTKVTIYTIGGSALMEHGIKNSTKDIDIVVGDKKSAAILVEALRQAGFKNVAEKDLQYAQLGSAVMLEKEGFPRIDLFVRKICNCLEFSSSMQQRSKKASGGKLEIYTAAVEDVFLLKSVSSRDSDLVDSMNILSKKPLNWTIIAKEIIEQEKNLKQVQELTILSHFELMEERLGIRIPIKNKILRIALQKSILFACKTPKSIAEIRQLMDFSEYALRNAVERLIKQKKLVRVKGTPLRFLVK